MQNILLLGKLHKEGIEIYRGRGHGRNDAAVPGLSDLISKL